MEILDNVTTNDWVPPQPHELQACTVTFPPPPAVVTLMVVVPCPAFKVQPAGMVQVYEVAPLTAVIEYVIVLPGHTDVGPDIAPGVAGVAPGETATHVNPLHPHPLHARTQTLPEVEPAVTVILVVPCPAVIVHPPGTVH